MKYRGIFEYEYPTEHKPPVSIDVHLHGDCVKGKIIEWKYRPLEQEPTDKNFTKADIDAIVKAINEGWELKVNEILDKMRAEIETKYGQCKLTEYIVQYDGICTSANDIGDIADILQIIDKYKANKERE